MKKIVLFALCAMALASCQKTNIEPQADEPEEWGVINLKGKKFVFIYVFFIILSIYIL